MAVQLSFRDFPFSLKNDCLIILCGNGFLPAFGQSYHCVHQSRFRLQNYSSSPSLLCSHNLGSHLASPFPPYGGMMGEYQWLKIVKQRLLFLPLLRLIVHCRLSLRHEISHNILQWHQTIAQSEGVCQLLGQQCLQFPLNLDHGTNGNGNLLEFHHRS